MMNEFICDDFLKHTEGITGKSAKLTMTSPPDKEETNFQTNEEYLSFLKKSFEQIDRITKSDGFIMLINTDRRENGEIFPKHIHFYKFLSELGWKIKEYKILVKNDPNVIDLYRLTYSHILFYTKTGTIKDKTPEFRKDIWVHQMPSNKNLWPFDFTEKVIENLSKEGDLVFDPFAGRGTALISAKKLKRNYLGFEILPELHIIGKAELEKNV
jgi:DNA modification methylase